MKFPMWIGLCQFLMTKRFNTLLLFLTSGLIALGQMSVVKDTEHMLAKAKPDYGAALRNIKPALENDESKTDPQTWFLAGKAALGVWNSMWLNLQIGQDLKENNKTEGAHALIDAFNFMVNAMPLDSLPNEKGKIKPKYTKEIRKTLAKYYRSYRNAGILLFDVKDLKGAYDAWDIYVNFPLKLGIDSKSLKPDEGNKLGQIVYYQGLAAIATGDNENAVKKFNDSRRLGFSNKDLYLYGMEASRRLGNDSLMIDFARAGNELYGKEDVSFSLVLINDCLTNKDYEFAKKLASEGLGVTNDDKIKSQLYDVLGVVAEHDGSIEEALVHYQKSVVYNADNAKSYFDLARLIYNESLKIAENGSKSDLETKATPGLKKAAEYFEKAYELNPELNQIPTTLYSLYYRLGVGYEKQADYWFKKQK